VHGSADKAASTWHRSREPPRRHLLSTSWRIKSVPRDTAQLGRTRNAQADRAELRMRTRPKALHLRMYSHLSETEPRPPPPPPLHLLHAGSVRSGCSYQACFRLTRLMLERLAYVTHFSHGVCQCSRASACGGSSEPEPLGCPSLLAVMLPTEYE
jgi:hypothetical protein